MFAFRFYQLYIALQNTQDAFRLQDATFCSVQDATLCSVLSHQVGELHLKTIALKIYTLTSLSSNERCKEESHLRGENGNTQRKPRTCTRSEDVYFYRQKHHKGMGRYSTRPINFWPNHTFISQTFLGGFHTREENIESSNFSQQDCQLVVLRK